MSGPGASTTRQRVRWRVNGEELSLEVEPQRLLLDVLRDDLGLTGVKDACSTGDCVSVLVAMLIVLQSFPGLGQASAYHRRHSGRATSP